MTVILSLLHAIGFGRDNGLNFALRKVLQHMIGVIAFVGQHRIGFESFYQCLRMRHIAFSCHCQKTVYTKLVTPLS